MHAVAAVELHTLARAVAEPWQHGACRVQEGVHRAAREFGRLSGDAVALGATGPVPT